MKNKRILSWALAVVLGVVLGIAVERILSSPEFVPTPTAVLSTPIELVEIPPGEFLMGSPEAEEGRYKNEGPQHRVRISYSFKIGKTEVTQGQWRELMGTTVEQQWILANEADNVKYLRGSVHDQCPMVWINWQEAMDFCAVLDRRERTAGSIPEGYEYRLPTEAEWEYACRAGTVTRFHGGNDKQVLAKSSWYAENSGTQPYPDVEWEMDFVLENKLQYRANHRKYGTHLRRVAQKLPNAWGLFDMHGNAMEWSLDWYGEYSSGEAVNPFGPATGSARVSRGGTWAIPSRFCRSASRVEFDPNLRDSGMGFRVVLAPVRESAILTPGGAIY